MLNKLDFLGPSVSLFHKGDGRITSMLGGILTLLAMIFFVFMFGFFSLDIFLKEDPRISFSVNLEDNNELEVKELGLAFLIAPLRYNTGFHKTKHNRIKVIGSFYVTGQDSDETSVTQFDLVSCPSTALFKENRNGIMDNLGGPPHMYYCIPDSFEGDLRGARSKGLSHILSIELQVCSDEACLDPAETMKMLDNYYFQILSSENYVDSFSFDEPLKHSFMAFSAVAFSSFSQNYEIYLRHLDVDSDDGWIFTNVTSERGFRFLERNFSTGPSEKSTNLLRFTFMFDDKKEVYKRSYIKIPEIVANTGGIMKASLMMFSFLVKQVGWHRFYEDEVMRLKRFVNKEYSHFGNTSQSNSTGNFAVSKPVYKSLKVFNKTFKSLICCSKERQVIKKYERFFKRMVSDEMIKEMAIDFVANKRNALDFPKKIQKSELELVYEGRVNPQTTINNFIGAAN